MNDDLFAVWSPAADVSPPAAPPPDGPAVLDQPPAGPDKPKRSQASELVDLAEQRYQLGMSTDGEAFATPRGGAYVARMLRGAGGSLRAELASAYAAEHGRVPSSQALADTMLVLEGKAMGAARVPLALRVGQTADGRLILDLGDETGRAAVVSPDGWEVVTRSPMLFRRSALTAPLPDPVHGGDLEAQWALLNVNTVDRDILVGYEVAALFPGLPHPAALFRGEQGTAKTSAARKVGSLVDPSTVPMRKPPKDAEGWVTAAAGSWVVGIDNLSGMPEWLQDSLCRAVTGEGDVRRKLYSDGDLYVFSFRRVLLLTSIDLGALNGDLAERLIVFELDLISEDARLREEQVDADWRAAHPGLLGGLLDLTAQVLRVLPDVHPARLPRMADFARILAAVDRVRGTTAFDAYTVQGRRTAAEVGENDVVAGAVKALVAASTEGRWTGTANQLHHALAGRSSEADRKQRDWPKNPQALGGHLRRIANALRSQGVTVDYDSRARPRLWTFDGQPPDREVGGSVDALDALDGTPSDQREHPANRPSSSPSSNAGQGLLDGLLDGPETPSDLRLVNPANPVKQSAGVSTTRVTALHPPLTRDPAASPSVTGDLPPTWLDHVWPQDADAPTLDAPALDEETAS